MCVREEGRGREREKRQRKGGKDRKERDRGGGREGSRDKEKKVSLDRWVKIFFFNLSCWQSALEARPEFEPRLQGYYINHSHGALRILQGRVLVLRAP